MYARIATFESDPGQIDEAIEMVRSEVDYKQSLTSSDRFVVRSRLEAQGKLRIVFVQEIERLGDKPGLCVQARITAATLRNGRPAPSPEIMAHVPPAE